MLSVCLAAQQVSHLDGDDRVGQSFGLARRGDLLRHGLQSTCRMLDLRRLDDDLTVEVAEHPLGPAFGTVDGTVDGDDPEPFRPDRLDLLLNLVRRLPIANWPDLSLAERTGCPGRLARPCVMERVSQQGQANCPWHPGRQATT